MKSKATGYGSISTKFSSIVSLCVSSIMMMVMMMMMMVIIIIIIIIIITTIVGIPSKTSKRS